MAENRASVLIIAKPSRMRDGLRALLRTIPYLTLVGQVDDGLSAIKTMTDQHPALVLLGANLLDEDIQTVLAQIKAKWPETRCIVLVDNVQQQWIAKAAGADSALLVGFPASKFVSTIQELLSWETI
jgi:DNA-binding NarL/FixJ family response regulator